MGRQITMATRNELLANLRKRYRSAGRAEEVRILDEFVAISGYHRKHATRLLGDSNSYKRTGRQARRIYDEAVLRAFVILWETADRTSG